MFKNSTKLLFLVSVIVCLTSVAFLINRIFYGVDFTDEALYSALPKSFAEGRSPFLDELVAVQTAAILLIPITKIFLFFSARGDGIVLFFRVMYLLLSGACCLFLFHRLRRHLAFPESLLIATLTFSFWPFAIPSLSYNTLGGIFAAFAVLALAQAEEARGDSYMTPISLVLFGMSSWSYPTYFLPSLVTVSIFVWLYRPNSYGSRVRLLSLLMIAVGAGIAIYVGLFYIGLERLRLIASYASSFGVQGGGAAKWIKLATQFAENFWFITLITGAIWLVVLVTKRSVFFGGAILAVFSWNLFRYPEAGFTVQPYHLSILAIAIASIPSLWLLSKRAGDPFFNKSALIAVAFGLASAWSSSNGLTNFAVGSILGVAACGRYVSENLSGKLGARWIVALLLCTLTAFQVSQLYISIYSDGPGFKSLNTVVTDGPYKWLRTSKQKAEFLRVLSADVRNVEAESNSIAFFESFVVGYLLTDIPIKSATIWTYSLAQFKHDRETLARYYDRPENLPEVIFWQNTQSNMPGQQIKLDNDFNDPLRDVLASYELRTRRAHYSIYKRRNEVLKQ